MCTVTYIPFKEGFFITSNRDEKLTRQQANAPAVYMHNGISIIYPKDTAAGGTWIGLAENGHTAVLLNGAFKKHIAMPPYRNSRGVIFIEIIASPDPFRQFWEMNLDNIEPFTIILFCSNNLYECRWDGQAKHHKILNRLLPQIWSSVTLYEEAIVKKREAWFTGWIRQNATPSQNDILQFHQFSGEGDLQNDLLMNRDNITLTVSITSIEWEKDTASVAYLDILKKERFSTGASIAATNHSYAI